MEKLAINGGIPVRETPLSYGKQYIDETDVEAVAATLRSDYLTCGPRIEKLEKELCDLTGAGYCVAVSNGTAALHIAAMAAGIQEGDEVITTPITFAASANCILYCGGKPVFADINPETYNIDPASIEAHITPRTKAVVAVDFTGQAADLDPIRSICRRHGLTLIEDAAHSIGTKYNGQPVGSHAGGYEAMTFDITEALLPENTLVLRVKNDLEPLGEDWLADMLAQMEEEAT